MDIDLLSKMVKELILDNDKVSLPELGAFVAEVVPATFSDKGYTVNPPYRRLSFRSNLEQDTLLAELYARANGVAEDIAGRIVTEFVSELAEVLKVKKTVVFPGLGRLRATKENNVFFVADEDLDIYPEGFGLEPVSLKTHQETREEVGAVMESLAAALAGTDSGVRSDSEKGPEDSTETVEENVNGPADGVKVEAEPVGPAEDVAELKSENGAEAEMELTEAVTEPVTEPAEDTPSDTNAWTEVWSEARLDKADDGGEMTPEGGEDVEPAAENGQEAAEINDAEESGEGVRKSRSTVRKVMVAAGCIVGAAAVLLLLYMILARLCPDFINSILYDEGELEVLRYRQQ